MIIEKHDAKVTNNDDPKKYCRIKVACAGILGDEEVELPMWIEPVLEWGWFLVPDVGETIEIEVVVSSEQDESFHQMSIDNLDAKWRGKRFYTSDTVEDQTEVRTPHPDFQVNYGKRRGFATPNGHILYFDDTKGQEKIQLTWKQTKGEEEKYSYITFDNKGSILIANMNGTFINLDADLKTLTLVDENKNSLNMSEDGIAVIDNFDNVIEMKDGVVQVISQDAIVLTGKSANLKTGAVDLAEGADSFVIRGTELLIWLAAHVHGAPGTPPVVGIPPIPTMAQLISKVVKTK